MSQLTSADKMIKDTRSEHKFLFFFPTSEIHSSWTSSRASSEVRNPPIVTHFYPKISIKISYFTLNWFFLRGNGCLRIGSAFLVPQGPIFLLYLLPFSRYQQKTENQYKLVGPTRYSIGPTFFDWADFFCIGPTFFELGRHFLNWAGIPPTSTIIIIIVLVGGMSTQHTQSRNLEKSIF